MVKLPFKSPFGIVAVAFATASSLFLSGCSMTGEEPSSTVKANNEALTQMLDLRVPSVGGPERRIGDYRGKVVMLHFFSSWCGQCGIEAPSIRNVHESFKDSKFTVLGVAVDDDPFQTQAFVSKYSLTFPVLLDPAGDLKTFFGIKGLPATVFLDRRGMPIRFQDPESGEVTGMIEGPRQWDSTKPVEMIAQLVEGLP